jgi:hypothetical protein
VGGGGWGVGGGVGGGGGGAAAGKCTPKADAKRQGVVYCTELVFNKILFLLASLGVDDPSTQPVFSSWNMRGMQPVCGER